MKGKKPHGGGGGTIEYPTGNEVGADKIMSDACAQVAPVDRNDPKHSLMLSVYYDRSTGEISGVNAFKGPTNMLLEACEAFAEIVNHILVGDGTGIRLEMSVETDPGHDNVEHVCASCSAKIEGDALK